MAYKRKKKHNKRATLLKGHSFSCTLLLPSLWSGKPSPWSLVWCLSFNPHHHLPPAPRSCLQNGAQASWETATSHRFYTNAVLLPLPSAASPSFCRDALFLCSPRRHKPAIEEIKCECYQCSVLEAHWSGMLLYYCTSPPPTTLMQCESWLVPALSFILCLFSWFDEFSTHFSVVFH